MKAKLFTVAGVKYADTGYAIWNIITGALLFWMSPEDYYIMRKRKMKRKSYLREQILILTQ